MPNNTPTPLPPVAGTGSKGKSLLSFTQGVVPLVIAVAVLYIFWSLVKTMMGMTTAPDLQWSRATYLFAGVEAIAYAAAGFLFGREVHRQRAEQAEQLAGTERKRAAEAEKAATEEKTKGKALRGLIEAKRDARRQHSTDTEGLESFRVDARPPAGGMDMDELSRVAEELFP